MERKANGLLKVCGILMIIGGALSLLIAILGLAGSAVLSSVNVDTGGLTGILMVASILALIGGAIELVAGILGTKNAAKPEKAGVCVVFGILVIVVAIVSTILTMAGGSAFPYLSLIISLVLPILYLIGAFQNKKLA